MSIKPLPDTSCQLHTESSNINSSISHRFINRSGGWFVTAESDNNEIYGPFTDKADAQMALMYFTARDFWPNDKQLREFARSGR